MGNYYRETHHSSAEKSEAKLLVSEWLEGNEDRVFEACNKRPGLVPHLVDALGAKEGQRLLDIWMRGSLSMLPHGKL